MKSLQNKETRIKNQQVGSDQAESKMKYSDLILIAVKTNLPNGGISADEIGKRIRIISAIDKALEKNGDLIFEDNDAEKLKEIIKTSKWGIIHEDIFNLQNDILSMKDFE